MYNFKRSNKERLIESYKSDFAALKESLICIHEAFMVDRPDEAKEVLKETLIALGYSFDAVGCIIPELDD